MKAVIYKSTGSWYSVKDETGVWHNARLKGVFKIEGITSTNPVAVGDEVLLETSVDEEKTAIISEILPRKNYINRQSPRHKHQQHIVGANVDQSVLVVTLKEPRTSQGFIDRFLIAAEMYHVNALLVFNKIDLYGKKEEAIFQEWKEVYESIGYKVLQVSTHKEIGIQELKEHLQNKRSLFSGHSGVGKSSLLNLLIPELTLRTQNVSGWSGKGMHTTTFAEMFDLPEGGQVIDTPGMREFGLVHIEKEELSHYFPEMRTRLDNCQFNNCLHINEPHCAIKKAVADNIINENRYLNYLSIFDSIRNESF